MPFDATLEESQERSLKGGKRNATLVLIMGLAALTSGPLQTASSSDNAVALAQMGPTYVGSDKCATCHRAHYDTFLSTGHPYKLRTGAEARAAGVPKPEYVSWDDVLFVIGGFKWKARYVGQDGFLITQSKDGKIQGKNQYNLETEQFVDYNAGKSVKYDCGECHTTGYAKEGNQLGKPGLIGTWAFNGVQCEACHGPGSAHLSAPSKTTIKKDASALACAQCHRRGTLLNADGTLHKDMDVIPAVPPFIDHREQFQMLRQSKHKDLGCVTCHNPHKRAREVKNTCATCHGPIAADFKDSKHDKAKITCESCHMANAEKTAVQRSRYAADLPAHLFRINLDPAAPMFAKTAEGKDIAAGGYLTLAYACLPCHSDHDANWAAEKAKGVHKLGK
jgi:predicted CXXCH cytochrome family protein